MSMTIKKALIDKEPKKPVICSICGEPVDLHRTSSGKVYWDYGHNAGPINNGRCCDWCNENIVVRLRIKMAMDSRRKESGC